MTLRWVEPSDSSAECLSRNDMDLIHVAFGPELSSDFIARTSAASSLPDSGMCRPRLPDPKTDSDAAVSRQ